MTFFYFIFFILQPNEERNVLEESAGFEFRGELAEPEVRTRTKMSLL